MKSNEEIIKLIQEMIQENKDELKEFRNLDQDDYMGREEREYIRGQNQAFRQCLELLGVNTIVKSSFVQTENIDNS